MRVYQAALGVLAASAALACSGEISGGERSDGLVFVGIVDGSNELMRARLLDGAVEALTATPDREESWPYWSPIARRLVFQVAYAGSRSDLVLWAPGDGEEPFVKSAERVEAWPAWAPSDAQLIYAFRGGKPAAGLAMADLETGERKIIGSSGPRYFFFRPTFSPDGATVVVQRREPGEGSNLWILDRGDRPWRLTEDAQWFDYKPAFTRDGSRIFFSRRRRRGGASSLASIAPDGSGLQVLESTRDSDTHSVVPSPTRDEIAFVSNRDGKFDVFLADLSGENARKLTLSSERSDLAPRWSPDGERLVVTSTPVGAGQPRLGDRAGLAATHIVVLNRAGDELFEAEGFMPDWMPPWR
jgi:Tol biopolymer transport system component